MVNKYYINVEDRQGGSWAMGCLDTIKEWKQRALEWCDSDENWEMYRYIKRHKLDEELLDFISDVWDIKIVPFNKEHMDEILESYGREEYYWLLQDCMEKVK